MWLDNELLKQLQQIAVYNATCGTVDSLIEYCYRYYSKTYHTPLKQVKQEMSAVEVILIYFEDKIYELPSNEKMRLKSENLAVLQPVYPKNEQTTLNSIDEEAEEEILLDQLAKSLYQEQLNKEKKKENKSSHNTDNNFSKQAVQEGEITFDIPEE